MSNKTLNYTEPKIVTTNDLAKRSYVEFYFNNNRKREYHGKNINKRIEPNRAKSIPQRDRLLIELQYELKKALEANFYPSSKDVLNTTVPAGHSLPFNTKAPSALASIFKVVKIKLRSGLSKTYKRDLKAVYRDFKSFLTIDEQIGLIQNINTARVDEFLSRYGSTGTYYMNKRRNLSVLFNGACKIADVQQKALKESERRKVKAKLHIAYEREQLKPILEYLRINSPNLYLCCLLTYGSWLRPHEEVRLLTCGDFKKEFTEIHLTGDHNKGGKVRVVYVPDYIQEVIVPIIKSQNRTTNIFTLNRKPYNESYFNTQWSRAYKKMFALGLIYENQTIYSFRHTAAVDTYRRTKDVYLLQKLLGHSSILVTLKYLRSLGEFNSEELRNAAPQL